MERPRWASDRSGSVRASSISTSARAAKVHHVLTPLISQPPSAGVAARDDAGHVGAEVGLGHRDRGHDLGRGQLGQPVLLLLLGPAVDQGPGQDLGPGDERAADAERAPASAPRWPRPCPGSRSRRRWRSRRTPRGPRARSPPSSARPAMISSGMSPLVAVDVLGVRADLAPRRSGGRSRGPARSRSSRWRGPSMPASAARTAGSRLARRRSRPPASIQPASTPQSRFAARPPGRPGRPRRRPRRRAAMRASASPWAP